MSLDQHKSAAQLEAEVQAQRARVEGMLDELQGRLSPGQLVDQALAYARNGGGADFVRNLGRATRDHPLPLALMGVSLAWLMATSARPRGPRWPADEEPWLEPSERDAYGLLEGEKDFAVGDGERRLGAAASEIGDIVTHAAAEVGDAARRTGQAAREAARRTGRAARSSARRTGDAARSTADAAARYGRQARHGLAQMLDEQPLVLGAIGVAIGAALGALLRPTTSEDAWLGEASDAVRRRAGEVAKDEAGKLRSVADAAVEAAAEQARRNGLGEEAAAAMKGEEPEAPAKPEGDEPGAPQAAPDSPRPAAMPH
jgi:ElaB/YqjD/DUF883 family membrane-anchored ribosome-binding protein